MSDLKRRLTNLEQAQAPKPCITVYEQAGRRWLAPGPDYRACYGGPGAIDITPAEYAELERTHDIILVKYADLKQPGEMSWNRIPGSLSA